MFRQPPVHISALSGPCDWGAEEGWYAVPVQDGRVHEEPAKRKCAVPSYSATDTRCVIYIQYPHDSLLTATGFNEFIHERESKRADDPTIKLFDEVILAKRNRGKSSFFYKSKVDFLSDTTDHLWRTASANPPSSRFPGDYRAVISRIPAKLDPTLMKEPRVIQGVPRIPMAKARRKPIPSMLGPNGNANTQVHTS